MDKPAISLQLRVGNAFWRLPIPDKNEDGEDPTIGDVLRNLKHNVNVVIEAEGKDGGVSGMIYSQPVVAEVTVKGLLFQNENGEKMAFPIPNKSQERKHA